VHKFGAQNIYYPFAVEFRQGDYVRMVGTLWEDGPHINGTVVAGIDWACNFNPKLTEADCGVVNEAKKCWNSDSTQGRGWTEMHPVDLMERLGFGGAPSPIAYAWALCTGSGDSANVDMHITPNGRRWPRSTISVHEYIDGTFTNWRSLHGNAAGGARYFTDADQAYLRFGVSGDSSHRGLFKGMYTAEWTCTPDCSNRQCGDDGCGGSCGGCSAGQTCNNGQCAQPCKPVCRACGPSTNNCGPCPDTCAAPLHCDSSTGSCVCAPQCAGKSCGDSDGCGGTCQGCEGGQQCVQGQCKCVVPRAIWCNCTSSCLTTRAMCLKACGNQ
jgi:hypothetical protein